MRIFRLPLFAAAAALVALLSYWFFFPGHVNPFAIYHIDHYVYQGMSVPRYGLLVYFEKYPRPVAHVLIDLCGRLGPYGLLIPVFLVSFVNAGLLATYVERLTQRRVSMLAFLLVAALAYANPEFYVHIKADPFSVFALFFLLSVFHCWQTYRETASPRLLCATALLITILCLTKESYFGPLGLFFLLHTLDRPHRRAAAAALVYSALNMAYALHRDSQVWLLLNRRPTPADPYYTDFSAHSILAGLQTFASEVFYPAIAIAIVLILVRAWFASRSMFALALISLVMAFVSWLPNATLPNHLEPQYSCLSIFFVLTPFLLVSYLVPRQRIWTVLATMSGLFVYGLSLYAYGPPFPKDAVWILMQERSAERLLAGLAQIRRVVKPGDSSLVSGIDVPYSPFYAPYFILGYFGPGRLWTVIVPDAVAESNDQTVRLIHASHVAQFAPYSQNFTFLQDRLQQ